MRQIARVTLRYRGKLHIGIASVHRGKPVTMLAAGRYVRVLDDNGDLLRHLTLDRSRDYEGKDLECPG